MHLSLIQFFFFKRSTNTLGYMNVVLLHGNHKHVSTTHVAILSVMKGSTTVSHFSISTLQMPNNALTYFYIHTYTY